MSETANGDPQALAELRQKIDTIDAEMHRLLIQRGAVVDSLIRIKGTSNPANAFRPGREAEMMRRLVATHEGALPVTTVEHIWREIITTFTRLQASFDIAVDASFEPEKMRDLARFYFGFSVNLDDMPDATSVVARVGQNADLGVIALGRPQEERAWWRALVGASAPRIMSQLPFIRAKQRPADLPALVVSPPLADPMRPDIRILAVISLSEVANVDGVEVLANQKSAGRWDSLVAAQADLDDPAVADRAGVEIEEIEEVGSVTRGIALDGEPSLLYAAAETLGAK
jgi:chorismate mutase / prephenate dehydratase